MQHYRNRLALVWLGWSGVLVLYLAWRLLAGDTATGATITWLSPQIVPTLSLVCGVTALAPSVTAAAQDSALRAAYLRALIVSIFYLLVVTLATIAVMTTLAAAEDTLGSFGLLLGLLQGATAATLGIFFVKAPTPER